MLFRAKLYEILEQYDKALADYTKMIELDPKSRVLHNYNTYFERLKLYLKLGDLQKAEEDCNTFIELDPKDPEGYYYLSIIFDRQDRHIDAIDMLTTAITRLSDGGYYISSFDGNDIGLKDIYIKRGEIYQIMNIDVFMCSDYQKACNLGNCEMFNANCK